MKEKETKDYLKRMPMPNINIITAAPEVIGTLCLELHPEAQNKIEAVDLQLIHLNKHIRLKVKNKIKAADDIRIFFVLCEAKRKLMESTTIGQLTDRTGGNLGFSYSK